MTYALFDDGGGRFLAGRVMSEAASSLQVELDSGKRVKVKAANVLLRFEQPAPAELLDEAARLAPEIDLDLAWEFAPEDDFGFADMARDYFDAGATPAQQAATLLRLFEAPHYFHRAGKGQFRKASAETLQAALRGIERKQQVATQIDAWAAELDAGRCPPEVESQLYKLLFKPDKNAPEYKAVVQAARASGLNPLALLQRAGAIRSPYQFHWRRFLAEQFPQGTGFVPAEVPALREELPLAPVQAFSIDDSATTEIDDALSVDGLGSGTVRFGIHIAAPGLAIEPDSALDQVARQRLSTVYMPGFKLTMLPDDVVQAYTLAAGRDCPAVSLYLHFDEATLELREAETRLERVPVAANLRHDRLDAAVTEATLAGEAPADYPFAAELAFAFRLARHCKGGRETVRGKPETFSRPDYAFRLDGAAGEPTGDETVQISERRRGAPLDLIVAEAMILANSHWGGWLDACGVPGIYRSQASMLPGVKVRMGTKALPHAGMGVPQYSWATSPLRRYVDLVNQWQIIACARHGRAAALAAPFKPRDATLFSIISSFDAAHAAYQDFQHAIERYWTLRWIDQQGIHELAASVMKDGLVRADTLPLVMRAAGTEGLPRGSRVQVRLVSSDLLTLDVHAALVTPLDAVVAAAEGDDGVGDDDDPEGGGNDRPLALAISVDDEAPAEGAAPAPPAG